jgi:hypothetical protein
MFAIPATMHLIITWLIIVIFAAGAIVNLVAPGSIRDEYKRWGYPVGFRFVTAALEFAAAILMVIPSARSAGLILASLIMLAAIATLVRAKEFSHAIPATIVLILIATVWR